MNVDHENAVLVREGLAGSYRGVELVEQRQVQMLDRASLASAPAGMKGAGGRAQDQDVISMRRWQVVDGYALDDHAKASTWPGAGGSTRGLRNRSPRCLGCPKLAQ